ncbi:MAG: hypothetical protein K2P61_01720, partial [Burkholderiaceae bacterium]|nr:hypothetical protein [Burkholderiaceae bacterium]
NALLIHDPRQELLAQRNAELASIVEHTTLISDYRSLEKVKDYPEPVRKLLTRLSTIRLDRLAYRVL